MKNLRTDCCVVGGGPAGMMLGLLLARAGVDVTVLEKHADFLRDFRGDTVHPSTLEIIDQLGLMARFEQLPIHKTRTISVQFADGLHALGDFRGIGRYPYIAFVPQWDLLELLASEAKRYPNFRLCMSTAAQALVERDGRVVGVQAQDASGSFTIDAELVVACDGRNSTLRAASGLRPVVQGAPMDVLWFRLPRKADDPDDSFGIAGRGQLIAMIDRNDYWQVAFIFPKGQAGALEQAGIEAFRARLAQAAPLLQDRVAGLASWDAIKLLEVRVDRLDRWHKPGLLLIGDAAHAMSPIGGVGINLAVQDAVAAANVLGPVLARGEPVSEALLSKVQARREWATRAMQRIQLTLQQRVVAPALRKPGPAPSLPRWLDAVFSLPPVRALPARVFGYGFARERVDAALLA